jgi:hypothetical protein
MTRIREGESEEQSLESVAGPHFWEAIKNKISWKEWLNHKYTTRLMKEGKFTDSVTFENCPACAGYGFVPIKTGKNQDAQCCPICLTGQSKKERLKSLGGSISVHPIEDHRGNKAITCQFIQDCPFTTSTQKSAYCNLVLCKFDKGVEI